jgi:peptidyl-prolyl cis-trans isomerase A (cyclophilin A)
MLRLRVLVLPLLAGLLATSVSAGPPIARFQSVLGNFEVLLDPAAAPISVANFTAYANRTSYDSTIIHRSTTKNPFDIQIVQGGGFDLVGTFLVPVATDPPIPLEAGLANARGTLAMARSTEPNSAASQWYLNVTDNPGLDLNYAVFGRTLGRGQSVIDAMGAVPTYDKRFDLQNGAFGQLPLFGPDLFIANLVLINSVRVETFAITNITRTADTTELRWTALSSNTPVRVERTADLAGEPWTIIASNNTTGTFSDTNAPARGAFYRLVTEP